MLTSSPMKPRLISRIELGRFKNRRHGVTGMTVKTAKEVRQRLRARFSKHNDAVPMPEHVVLFEVPVDGVRRFTGVNDAGVPWAHEQPVRRRIDAVAVGMWRGTNHLIHGFEIKVSRADLLAELKDPDKAAPAIALVDRWWLVLGDAKILKDTDEVPSGWGVMVAHGRGLRVLREAQPTGGTPDPRFIAALIQSTVSGRGSTARALGRVDGYNAGYKSGETAGRRDGFNEGASHVREMERKRAAAAAYSAPLDSAAEIPPATALI